MIHDTMRAQTQAWVDRRKASPKAKHTGMPVTADDVHGYINSRWPTLDDETKEWIWQRIRT